MAKTAIFDIDGTLINSVDYHAEAWRQAFARFGHNFEFGAIRSQIGKGGDQLLPHFLSDDEIRDVGSKIESFRGTLFKNEFMPKVHAFRDVRPLFQHLLKTGWNVALASSAKKDEVKIYKSLCRIEDLVKVETTADDAERSKPFPDILLALIKQLPGVAPKDCIVIGDSPYDAEAAVKAHMEPIGVLCGGFSEETLRAAGCRSVFKSPKDLLDHFQHHPDFLDTRLQYR